MQFGINMLLWTTHVTTDHEAQLAFAKECGFDGVEIPTFEGDTTHFGQLASVLDRLGLESTSVWVIHT